MYYLYLSGTPFRALNSGEFIEDQIYNWTYSDEQRAKENWQGDGNPYAALPRMVMMTYRILMKQKEQLAAQEQKLEELTLKIEDVETLVEEVSDIAYDKAVEVVTDTVRLETHKEDFRLVEETKNWVLSPERKAPQKEREYAAARLDGVISKIKNAMQSALTKIQKKLMQPEVKQAGKQQIQEKAKESILAFLKKAKQDSAQCVRRAKTTP